MAISSKQRQTTTSPDNATKQTSDTATFGDFFLYLNERRDAIAAIPQESGRLDLFSQIRSVTLGDGIPWLSRMDQTGKYVGKKHTHNINK